MQITNIKVKMNEIESKHLKGSRKQNCSYVRDYKSRLTSKLIKKSETAQKYVKMGHNYNTVVKL